MLNALRRLALAIVALALAACTVAGQTPGPSGTPVPSSGSVGAIDHATGATDVLLRYEVGGGFVGPGFFATQAPTYTLYGDGTVIFQARDTTAAPAPANVGPIVPKPPFHTIRLSETEIQDVLAFALHDGGLAAARAQYDATQVADAPTSTFTIRAGGIDKIVAVVALGIEVSNGTDADARAAFQRLADRLDDADHGGTIPSDIYRPARYRGVLTEGSTAPNAIAWPWKDIPPASFVVPAAPNGFQSPQRVLTPADAAVLGVTDAIGGFVGLPLLAPDRSRTYILGLRPLLPEEIA
jgi:hypothetical protein